MLLIIFAYQEALINLATNAKDGVFFSDEKVDAGLKAVLANLETEII